MTTTIPKKTRKRNRNKPENATADASANAGRESSTASRIGPGPSANEPMITASNIHYELADRVQGLAAGGIGAMLLLARRTGLIGDIDHHLHLLKRHLPYHESDHVLNIAFNILAGGTTDRAPRTAAQRRGLSQRPGRRAHPRPHHRGRLLPPVLRVRRPRP